MKLSFFSNYLTHHQIPFSNEMYQMLNKDYTFISTEDMDPERKELGWEEKNNVIYEVKSFENNEAFETSLKLARESDVMIIGSAPEMFVKERMKCSCSGITLRYSERIYKNGMWRLLSPRGVIKRIDTYVKYPHKNLYMLCASAYTAWDLKLLGSYLGKCYKWGYFPDTIQYHPEELKAKKVKGQVELLWCGRFLEWKHPEVAIRLASMLLQEGLEFHLKLIGTGEMKNMMKRIIRDEHLDSYVTVLGGMPPDKVRRSMERADIFLFTSDFNEGWGAVVNEAMNSGCAVVASHAVGSVPFLIEDGINGMIYQNGNMNSLFIKVKQLILDKQLCENLGRNAYETIVGEWNAKVAARRLLLLIEDLKEKGWSDRFQSGPCSKAEIIKNNWYGDKRK